MTYKILVALQPGDDFSSAAERAREISQAASGETAIRLCCVLFDSHIADHRAGDHAPVVQMQQVMIDSETARVEAVAAHLHGICDQVDVQVRWGAPSVDELINAAREFSADLIIVTARHHSKLSRAVFNHADWELMRLSSIPVLFAQAETFQPYESVLAAVDPVHSCDVGSDLDDELIRVARRMSAPFGGEVFLAHAYPNPALTVMAEYAPPADLFNRWEKTHRAAVAVLADRNAIPADHVYLKGDEPKRVIPQIAEAVKADLIVLGSVSRRHKRRIIGQNAGYMLDHADCDVLVVRAGPAGELVRECND